MGEPAFSFPGVCMNGEVNELFPEKSGKTHRVGHHLLGSNKIKVLDSCLHFGMREVEIS